MLRIYTPFTGKLSISNRVHHTASLRKEILLFTVVPWEYSEPKYRDKYVLDLGNQRAARPAKYPTQAVVCLQRLPYFDTTGKLAYWTGCARTSTFLTGMDHISHVCPTIYLEASLNHTMDETILHLTRLPTIIFSTLNWLENITLTKG